MVSKTIFMMLFLSTGCLALNFTAKRSSVGNVRLVGGTTTNTASNSWVALLVDTQRDEKLGMAAILSKEWLISANDIFTGVANVGDVKVIVGVDDSVDVTTGTLYPVKKIVPHADIDGIKNNIALIKVCPKMSVGTAILIPASPMAYNPDADMGNIFAYTSPLASVTKKIGEVCECEDDPKFDKDMMFCLAPDVTKHVEATDIVGPVTINNELAGLLVQENSDSSEIAINLSKYMIWITSTTGI